MSLIIENLIIDVINNKKNIQSKYIRLINNISIEVKKGDFVALIGNQESGKTTLLNYIYGYYNGKYKISGKISYNGKIPDINNWSDKILFIEESYFNIIDESMTIENFLMETATYCELNNDNIQKRVDEIIKIFNLVKICNNKLLTLTLCQKKRVYISISLLRNYEILIIDEPIRGLNKKCAYNIIKLLKKQVNMTVICTIYKPYYEILKEFNSLILLDRGLILNKKYYISSINNRQVKISKYDRYYIKTKISFAKISLIFCNKLYQNIFNRPLLMILSIIYIIFTIINTYSMNYYNNLISYYNVYPRIISANYTYFLISIHQRYMKKYIHIKFNLPNSIDILIGHFLADICFYNIFLLVEIIPCYIFPYINIYQKRTIYLLYLLNILFIVPVLYIFNFIRYYTIYPLKNNKLLYILISHITGMLSELFIYIVFFNGMIILPFNKKITESVKNFLILLKPTAFIIYLYNLFNKIIWKSNLFNHSLTYDIYYKKKYSTLYINQIYTLSLNTWEIFILTILSMGVLLSIGYCYIRKYYSLYFIH